MYYHFLMHHKLHSWFIASYRAQNFPLNWTFSYDVNVTAPDENWRSRTKQTA